MSHENLSRSYLYYRQIYTDYLSYDYFRFFFQAEDGIRDVERSRGLGDVYKRQHATTRVSKWKIIWEEIFLSL